MILVDTGPLVAAFDRSDPDYAACTRILAAPGDALTTTLPVLTEAFHLLRRPRGTPSGLMNVVINGDLGLSPLDDGDVRRCFELMFQYADAPMDFADASLVAVGERSGTDRVFTLDRRHFPVYRMKRGHRHAPFTIIGPGAEPPTVREPAEPYGVCPPESIAESALRDVREALDRLGRVLMR